MPDKLAYWFSFFFVWPFAQETDTSSHQKVFGEYCFAKELSKGKIVWKWKKYKENWKYNGVGSK